MNEQKEPKVILLQRDTHTTISVHLFGGNITSWKINNQEQLFVSRIVRFSELEGVSGGFSFSFPIWSQWEFGPQFGFLRNIMWVLDDGPNVLQNGDVWAKFSTKDDAYTRSFWNFKFKFSYVITLQDKSLIFDITVHNYDERFFFEFNCILTGMFKLASIEDCEIVGLGTAKIRKRVYKNQDKNSSLAVDCLEAIYANVSAGVFVTNLPDEGAMKIKVQGNQEFSVYNPKYGEIPFKNIDTSNEIEDFEYQYFIATNCGSLSKPVRLLPKSKWRLRVRYQRIFPCIQQQNGQCQSPTLDFANYC